MRRTQIQLDERTYARLRRRAYERGCSISAVAREMLAEALGAPRADRPLTEEQFPFVGAGRSQQGALSPVSERHDEALAEVLVTAPHAERP